MRAEEEVMGEPERVEMEVLSPTRTPDSLSRRRRHRRQLAEAEEEVEAEGRSENRLAEASGTWARATSSPAKGVNE